MSKPVLMCVDDEEMILLSLKDQLRNHFAAEYTIETLESGEEALSLAEDLIRDAVDIPLVISDQIMPGMKGGELLRKIHALSPRTLKVLLTGQADAKAVGDAVNEANLYRYIPKPWEETDLVLTIKEATRSFYQDKKLEEQNETLREINENLELLVAERTNVVVEQKNEIQKQLEDIEEKRHDLELRNEFIRNVFGRYVTDDVMMTLLENPEGLKFVGEKREITVLMSDLRGFTSITEMIEPEKVVQILNHYLGSMVDVIARYNGTVIEFLGDGILVVFGAPKHMENHADQGIACALAMQLQMEAVNRYNAARNYPLFEMGIGLDSGHVVVGNIGSDKRAKYGVVGQTVNLASRIETLTTTRQVLISNSTKSLCSAPLSIRNSFDVSLKGVNEILKIYEVGGIGGKHSLTLPEMKFRFSHLSEPVAVGVHLLDGISVAPGARKAILTGASRTEAGIETTFDLSLHSDIKIVWTLHQEDENPCIVYAKVQSRENQTYRVVFTSLNGTAKNFIDGLESRTAEGA